MVDLLKIPFEILPQHIGLLMVLNEVEQNILKLVRVASPFSMGGKLM